MTAALTELADWIEDQLADELVSRQLVAETALSRLRELAAAAPRATGVAADGSAALDPADLLTVLGALSDAAESREARAAGWCEDCQQHPAGACESHVDDLDQAGAYRAVAVRLGDDR